MSNDRAALVARLDRLKAENRQLRARLRESEQLQETTLRALANAHLTPAQRVFGILLAHHIHVERSAGRADTGGWVLVDEEELATRWGI